VNGVISPNGSITQLDKRNIEYRTKYDYMMGKLDFTPIRSVTVNITGISSPTKVTGPTANLAFETTSTTTFNELRYPLKGGFCAIESNFRAGDLARD
jgi:hypothetical protein